MADDLTDEQKISVIEALDGEIEQELDAWREAFNATPSMVLSPDMFLMSIHFEVLLNMLLDSELVNRYDFTMKWKKELLETMQKHRTVGNQIKRQALVDQIVPKMDIPRRLH